MKKIYIQPSVKEVKVTTANILAGSINDVTVDPTKTTNEMQTKRGSWSYDDLDDEDF